MAAAGLASGAVAAGCFTASAGLDPPLQSFYYPTGVVVSPGRTALYVASSDFDLQYNGGTVQVLDLALLRATVKPILDALGQDLGAQAACALDIDRDGTVDIGLNVNELLHPGPCAAIPLVWGETTGLVRHTATIGAFASGATILSRVGGAGARLLVPVRGDPSITYFDIIDDRPEWRTEATYEPPCSDPVFCLVCGAADEGERCAIEYRVGDNIADNQRGLELPAEPVGIAAAPRPAADPIVVVHESPSRASLLVNRWPEGQARLGDGPTLEFLTGELPSGATEVASLPVPKYIDVVNGLPAATAARGGAAFSYQPGFLVTFRDAGEIDLLRYHDDGSAAPARPFLTRVGAIGINVNSAGDDSRGIAVDSSARAACEASCPASDATCLRKCVDVPLDLYVANRAPTSLLVGRVETHIVQTVIDGQLVDTGAFEQPSIDDTIPLAFGASQIALGQVIGDDGLLHRRVFAVAFDSRLVFSYDPAARRIDAVIRTGRGPHAIAFDTGDDGDGLHSYLYVGHFTDSYIGLVDLDMRRPQTFGSMVATIGQPVPPRESK